MLNNVPQSLKAVKLFRCNDVTSVLRIKALMKIFSYFLCSNDVLFTVFVASHPRAGKTCHVPIFFVTDGNLSYGDLF
jgi:hypothetical protein